MAKHEHEHEHDLMGTGVLAVGVGRETDSMETLCESGTYTEYHSVNIEVHRQSYHKTEIKRCEQRTINKSNLPGQHMTEPS